MEFGYKKRPLRVEWAKVRRLQVGPVIAVALGREPHHDEVMSWQQGIECRLLYDVLAARNGVLSAV